MSATRLSFFDVLLDQLQDPEVSSAISNNNGTRMFDNVAEQFGKRFNWMFVNYDTDLRKLVTILQHVGSVREDVNLGVCFTRSSDADIIRHWAKVILKHACRELLDSSNEIHSKILQLLPIQPEPELARNFIYAFFATYSAHLLADIAAKHEQYKIKFDLLTALTLLFKECSQWIEQIWPMPKRACNQNKRWVEASALPTSPIRFFGNLAETDTALPDFLADARITSNQTNK